MTLWLAILTLADLALAALLVGVSGFILQGVNNTGPLMPDAIFFVLLIFACLGAPAIAWAVQRRIWPSATLAIAALPLLLAASALVAGPA